MRKGSVSVAFLSVYRNTEYGEDICHCTYIQPFLEHALVNISLYKYMLIIII
jgi:hypothetical protein